LNAPPHAHSKSSVEDQDTGARSPWMRPCPKLFASEWPRAFHTKPSNPRRHGFSREYPVGATTATPRITEIYEGTSEIQRSALLPGF